MTRFVTWVWLGLVVGVSFVATPVKFTAESLTLPVALDVGRATFHLLNRMEIALVIALVALAWPAIRQASSHRFDVALIGLVGSAVALQSLWLLPALDARVATVIDGGDLEPSIVHTVFGVVEVAKVIALGVIGYRSDTYDSQDAPANDAGPGRSTQLRGDDALVLYSPHDEHGP